MKTLPIVSILLLCSLFTLNAQDTLAKKTVNPLIPENFCPKTDSLSLENKGFKADSISLENRVLKTDSLSVVTSHANTNSKENNNKSKPLLYGGFGLGLSNRGGILWLDYTLITSNNWGGNIGIKTTMAKSKDTPSDYFDDGKRTFSPKDYVSIISFNLVKEFPTPEEKFRYGIEAGPSWIRYSKAEFKINPNYHPDDGSGWWFSTYKYYKSHTITSTIGLSLRAKMEFLSGRHIGFDLAAFTNINMIKPVIGIESCFHFGKVRN